MPAHFENGNKYDGTEISVNVHTMLEQFQNNGNFVRTDLFVISATTRLDLDDKKRIYFNKPHKNVAKCSVLIVFEYSHDVIFKLCS